MTGRERAAAQLANYAGLRASRVQTTTTSGHYFICSCRRPGVMAQLEVCGHGLFIGRCVPAIVARAPVVKVKPVIVDQGRTGALPCQQPCTRWGVLVTWAHAFLHEGEVPCRAFCLVAGACVGSVGDTDSVKYQGQLGIRRVARFCLFGRPAVTAARCDVNAAELCA